MKGVAASKVGAAKAVVKSVRMGCEISSQKPIEAEVKLLITGRQVEVTRLVTTSEDHCDDNNCTVCFESPENSLGGSIDNIEAKAKIAKADARKTRRRREYRLKRKQKRREEKNARREAERAANLQMTGSGSSHGGSIDMGSSISGFTAGNSDETQSSVTNYSDEKESYVTRYTSRKKLPKNIVEIITILESSDSEDEMVRITRKMREREYN